MKSWITAFVIVVVVAMPALAGKPCVHFDVPDVVACRRLDNEQFEREHPGEMLVEAAFDVSSLVRLGSEKDLAQVLFVIESPPRSLRVFDYEPKTQLVTEHAGNVQVKKNSQKSANLGLNGTLSPDLIGSVSGNASVGKSTGTNVNYDMLPPKQLLATSGTIARGSAVFFKLKPSAQTSLDGAKRFTVVFRVNAQWRGDYVRLRCAAYGRSAADKRPICGSSDFLVGIYLVGDESARDTVSSLSRIDRRLRQLSVEKRSDVEQQRYPSVTDKLGALLHVSRPKIPSDWLRQAMRSEVAQGFEGNLPTEIRQGLMKFRELRTQVRDLNASKGALAASL